MHGQVAPRTESAEEIVTEVLDWSVNTVEQPHPIFAGLPVCPFARAARLKDAIRFEVRAFSVDESLDPDGWLLTLIADFAREEATGSRETLFVIHPERRAMSATALEAFVARLDRRLRDVPCLSGMRVFEAHPDSEFRVGDVYTRRGPYPSFQVLSHARLKATSDTLRGVGYYDHFTPAMLRAVGMPR
jgi:hypothetical protein